MSNIVKKETSGIIPKEIANITLEELMSTEGVEFHKKNNIFFLFAFVNRSSTVLS